MAPPNLRDVSIDAARYPEAAGYVQQLPAGLQSFPECRSRAVYLRDILERYPDLLRGEGLDPDVAGERAGDIDPDDWRPSVYVGLALTLVRDRIHPTDDSFLAWNYERQLGIYQRPLYRALMFLFSPTLLFMGASRRWTSFHTGSELKTEGDKSSAEIVLTYPPGLYSRVFRMSLVASFRAALSASKAGNQEVRLASDEPGRARYVASWG